MLRLADLLTGLSRLADLGFGLPAGEALRSCAIATALARQVDLPDDEVTSAFYTALLQHVGCTGYAHETSRVFGDELAMNATAARTNFASVRDLLTGFLPELTRGHTSLEKARLFAVSVAAGDRFGGRFATATCEVGRATARRLGLADDVQQGLYCAYEWWNGKGAPQGLQGDAIPLASRIARLAGIAALFDSIGGCELAVQAVRSRAGGLLDPTLVDVFANSAVGLLDQVNARDPRDAVLEAEPEPLVTISARRLVAVAAAFGDLADLKTPFTHGHSGEVAQLAHRAGAELGLGTRDLDDLRLAALLHDLGRVAISDKTWEKPKTLTSIDWEQVRLHPYHTERILSGSETLRPIARLAGSHHERLDGSGYHRGCRDRDLPMAARVLAAADAYQAMTQRRPHREVLSAEEAASELRASAVAGTFDPDGVAAVLAAAGHTVQRPRTEHPAGISDRELQVLRLVAEGCSNAEIARRLVISRRTAEHHVQHIYTKIGVSSRAAAALFAMQHDLLAASGADR